MNQLSKHFSRSEFKSKNDKWAKYIPVDVELITVLEDLREHFKKPVYINSGYRSKLFNDTLKNSSPTSKHCYGMAADIVVKGKKPNIVVNYLEKKYPNYYGIGLYIKMKFTHIDVSKIKRRWEIK